MPTIPAWIPPVTPAGTLNNQRLASEQTLTFAGDGSIIPIVYGPGQVGGRVYARHYDADTGTWTVGVYWCWGEIEAVDAVYINGAQPKTGVLQNDYTGTTSQGVDSLLSAAIGTGYTDDLVVTNENGTLGIAHTVLQYTDDHYPSPPEFVAEVRGRKLFDPRKTGHDSGDPSTWDYSVTPALAWRDLVTEPFFGPGESVDDDYVTQCADDNDATVSSEARRQIGLVLDKRQTWEAWRQTLESYAGGWGYKRGTQWLLVSDRPRSVDFTIGPDDMLPGTFKVALAPLDTIPTHVRLWYTDTTETIWRDRFVDATVTGVTSGSVPRRSSEVRMPGILRATQAKREATERLKKLQQFLQAEVTLYDDYIGAEVGDLFSVTHPVGFSSVLMRAIPTPAQRRVGRPTLRLVRYAASDYDDTETTVSFNDVSRYVGAGNAVASAKLASIEAGATASHGSNYLWLEHSDFDLLTTATNWVSTSLNGAPSISDELPRFGTKSVKLTNAAGVGSGCYLSGNGVASGYHTKIPAGRRWIVSFWVASDDLTTQTWYAQLQFPDASFSAAGGNVITGVADEYQQIVVEIDVSATNWTSCRVRLFSTDVAQNSTVYIDNVSLVDVTDHAGLAPTNYPTAHSPGILRSDKTIDALQLVNAPAQAAATVGAKLSTNLLDSLDNLLGDISALNRFNSAANVIADNQFSDATYAAWDIDNWTRNGTGGEYSDGCFEYPVGGSSLPLYQKIDKDILTQAEPGSSWLVIAKVYYDDAAAANHKWKLNAKFYDQDLTYKTGSSETPEPSGVYVPVSAWSYIARVITIPTTGLAAATAFIAFGVEVSDPGVSNVYKVDEIWSTRLGNSFNSVVYPVAKATEGLGVSSATSAAIGFFIEDEGNTPSTSEEALTLAHGQYGPFSWDGIHLSLGSELTTTADRATVWIDPEKNFSDAASISKESGTSKPLRVRSNQGFVIDNNAGDVFLQATNIYNPVVSTRGLTVTTNDEAITMRRTSGSYLEVLKLDTSDVLQVRGASTVQVEGSLQATSEVRADEIHLFNLSYSYEKMLQIDSFDRITIGNDSTYREVATYEDFYVQDKLYVQGGGIELWGNHFKMALPTSDPGADQWWLDGSGYVRVTS